MSNVSLIICRQEDEVLSRLRAASDNPLALEEAGYALFDMFPERRGNLFADEVRDVRKHFCSSE